MSLWTFLLQILAFIYVFVLPGMLVLIGCGNDWPAPVRWAAALSVGLLIVPMSSFCAAWIFGTNIQPLLVIGVATLVNVIAGAVTWWRRSKL